MFLQRTSTVPAALLLAGGAAMLSAFAGSAMASASSPVPPSPSVKAIREAVAHKPLRFEAGPAAMRARGARRVAKAITSPRTSSSLPTFTWQDLNSSKCLGVSGGNMTNGTPIVQFTCNGHPDQQWGVIPLNDGNFYQFRNGANNNKCLGVPGGSTNSDVQLVIWDCLSHPDQFWTAIQDPNTGCFVLQNFNSGLVVGVRGGSLLNSAAVVQFNFLAGHPDQEWC
jgi:hypothetical protein